MSRDVPICEKCGEPDWPWGGCSCENQDSDTPKGGEAAMSRPTRNEIEEALEWADLWAQEDYDWALVAINEQIRLVRAARAYAELAPDTCPECDGQGWRAAFGGAGDPGVVDCGRCDGRGYVWPDQLVTRVAKVVYRDYEECDDAWIEKVWNERPTAHSYDEEANKSFDQTVRDFELAAVKVLDALLEVGNE